MPTATQLGLIFALGLLGSFGHCAGMCGPVVLGVAWGHKQASWGKRWRQQMGLHLGRVATYTIVGAVLGQAGSLLVAGGQLAGVGSLVRQGVTVAIGLVLIGSGWQKQVPGWLRWGRHPQGKLPTHPVLLGLLWGLIPCGFLYVAQLQAVATLSPVGGAVLMLAFGLGTVPVLLGLGLWLSRVGTEMGQRLNRWAGGLTMLMGGLMLLRNDGMVDVTGYGSFLLLGLALIARPIQRLWPGLRTVRRELGVGAFILAVIHTLHMVEHSFQWDVTGVFFLPEPQFWGVVLGAMAVGLMVPLAITSTDGWVQRLGKYWHDLHRFAIVIWVLAAGHIGLMMGGRWGMVGITGFSAGVVVVILLRQSWWWRWWHKEQWYEPADGGR
ncbi:MAG: sulfite exporter TauE/SafE family protein [Gloeomargarita sp. HHBFW_bins_162]